MAVKCINNGVITAYGVRVVRLASTQRSNYIARIPRKKAKGIDTVTPFLQKLPQGSTSVSGAGVVGGAPSVVGAQVFVEVVGARNGELTSGPPAKAARSKAVKHWRAGFPRLGPQH